MAALLSKEFAIRNLWRTTMNTLAWRAFREPFMIRLAVVLACATALAAWGGDPAKPAVADAKGPGYGGAKGADMKAVAGAS